MLHLALTLLLPLGASPSPLLVQPALQDEPNRSRGVSGPTLGPGGWKNEKYAGAPT